MKFGAQIKSKSVPEWKSYNIDYNHLKFKIKVTTETSNNHKQIADLHNEFIEQIDMVNLFLNSKIGEVKRRIIYIENLIEQQQSQHQQSREVHIDVENYLSSISSDLQKLSRFIMIQKTGLRKLLKKYTKYSKDGGDLNMKINKYMIKNNDSFIHIDLTGLYLELALIYDLIRSNLELVPTNSASSSQVPPQHSNKTRGRRSSYTNPELILSINELFDYESIKEGNYVEKFLVHYDNLQELKIFLLANFYFVNQSVSSTRQNIELKKQTSTMSLRQIIGRSTSNEDLPLVKKQQKIEEEGDDDDKRSSQIYKSNSIYLNEGDELVDNTLSALILEDPKNFTSIKNETEPGMFLTDLENTDRMTLMTAIGGLRKTSCVLLQDPNFFKDLLRSCLDGEAYQDFYQRHEAEILPLSSLEKISIEWIYSKNVKPLVKVKLNKSRFTNLKINLSQDSKFKSWITLKSNVKLSEEDLFTNDWTDSNENNSTSLPYAVLEIRWNSPNVPGFLQRLLDSHLIYNIDRSFNSLTFSLYKFNKLSFKPQWAQLFESNIDIRKLPPKIKRNKSHTLKVGSTTSATANSDNGSSHNPSVSGESTVQFRYWNEFDNGSDFENDAAFMVDVSSSDEHRFLSNASIDWFYKISNNFHDFLITKLPWLLTEEEPQQVIPSSHLNQYNQQNGYGSLESDMESLNEQIKTHQQSTFMSSLALLSALFALLLTAVSLGITASIFNSYDDVSLSPVIVGVLTITMLISLFLGILAICLIMSCEQKTWGNLLFVWGVFIGVTVFIIGGIGSVFGI